SPRGPRAAHVCEVATGRHVQMLPVRGAHLARPVFSPDGRWLALVTLGPAPNGAPGMAPSTVLVDTATWTPRAVAPAGGESAYETGMQFSPDGTGLAMPKSEGQVVVFDLPRGPAPEGQ